MPANVKVLAKDAAQVAARKKDSSGASPTTQAILLAKVGSVTRHNGVTARLANSKLVRKAVNLTITWTRSARFERTERALNASRQFAAFLKA